MGKIELTIQIDERTAREAEALGMSLADYIQERLRPRGLDLVASADRQRADPAGAAARGKKWAEENAEAIASHNRFVEEYGEFGAEWRTW